MTVYKKQISYPNHDTGLFLLTAYCLRTKALERRVKAMDTAAVDTHGSNNQAFQQNNLGVPNIMEIPGASPYQ